ncbi:hypothetical protein [Cupriavidus alkaliphilus]|uniref:Uncharacterized protein n=1 Tax=Cupriavidus alkaliphilus TaxID=942866 RepID=A0A7W4VEQ1_9BURK|nr:hypothetical protein [Cupriavidus alkaliphilus]MBB3010251.1 hypothetical protein [Cupriavidus alkaliphilus]
MIPEINSKNAHEIGPLEGEVHLIFLWLDNEGQDGVFVTRSQFEFLERFALALNCDVWGEFLTTLGRDGWEVIDPYLSSDPLLERETSVYPTPMCRLVDLADKLWIFYDAEFPLIQCVEETFNQYLTGLLDEKDHTIMMEYSMPIGFYPKARFAEIEHKLEQKGINVDSKPYQLPYSIYNYAPSSRHTE